MDQNDIINFEEDLKKLWKKHYDDDSSFIMIVMHHDKQAISFFGTACIVCIHDIVEVGIDSGAIQHKAAEHLSEEDEDEGENNNGNNNKQKTH